jgi:hypothetical protein
MMRIILTAAIAALALGTTGCVTMPKPEELASADFGQFPTTYQQVIQNYMSENLKDPDSATYRFEAPRKGFSQDGWAVGGRKYFGYVVAAHINAKNSFGGYTGAQLYYFLLHGKGEGEKWQGTISDVTGSFNVQMAMFVDQAMPPTAEASSQSNSDQPSAQQEPSWPAAAKDAAIKRCEKGFESFQLQAVCLSNEKAGYEKLKGNFGMPDEISLKAKERCAKTFEMLQLQAVCMDNESAGYKKIHD